MNPEEKAKELAMKFDKYGETDNAKQCALIAIEYILECCIVSHEYYWKLVRQEINKL